MKNICFYFQVHSPLHLKTYRFFEIGEDHYYYDDYHTEEQLSQLVQASYLPATQTILEMIRNSNGRFKCSFSISGVVLEQFEQYAPEIIDSFKELAQTNCVEFLLEPYAHSLSSVYDMEEFELQLKQHADKIEELFGKRPTTLCNTELIYSDEIAAKAYELGYKTIMGEGAKHILGWKSANYVYHSTISPKQKILMRNMKLSDDLVFRFSDYSWNEYPLTNQKYIDWIKQTSDEEPVVTIGLGYEVFGHIHKGHTGIFEFLKSLPYYAMEQEISFMTPSEATKKIEAKDVLSIPHPSSWTGEAKDLSAWNGNDLQNEALTKLYGVAGRVHLCADKALKHDWLMLQSAENFRYMSHHSAYNSNYASPYDAFMNYMNILADFLQRVDLQYPTTIDNEELNELLKTINSQEKEIVQLEKEIKTLRARKAKVAK